MAAYGFLSGLPLPLSGFTFRLWLSDAGAGLTIVGLTAWIGLAYSLKFLWSPALDRMPPVPLVRRFGRRRGWLLLVQPSLALAVVLLAASDPGAAPAASFAAAACVAVLSATQDIAIDAWRIEVFPERWQGLALALYVWGYRVALLAATTGVIAAAGRLGWHTALAGAAALIVLGVPVTLAAPDPGGSGVSAGGLRHAVLDPVRSFFRRPSACLVLGFVALFKLGEAMAGIMTAPFYRSLDFDKAAIAATGPFSLGGTLAGITLGGWLVARIGVGRALLLTGWAQTVAMAMYVLLSVSAGRHDVLYLTVLTEAFAQGMADAAFLSFLSGLCDRMFAATQYALLSSVPQLAIHTIGGASGVMAASLGWTLFYAVCMGGALPGMALMLLLLRRAPRQAEAGARVTSS
ncbi:MAG TPA: MFS transporter [Rhodopila sp.]|nr:MFS transporter [Rhodopila sp.]